MEEGFYSLVQNGEQIEANEPKEKSEFAENFVKCLSAISSRKGISGEVKEFQSRLKKVRNEKNEGVFRRERHLRQMIECIRK